MSSNEVMIISTIETTPLVDESCVDGNQSQSTTTTLHPLAPTLTLTQPSPQLSPQLSPQQSSQPSPQAEADSSMTNTNDQLSGDRSVSKVVPKQREDAKRRRTRRSKKRKRQRVECVNARLQWSESSEQEVKRLHMKVVEHGQPLAPYNTTQFIMNDHNCDKEIDFDAIRGRLQRMRRNETHTSDHNEEDFYSSPEDESDYLQQQFDEAYDHIHAERLSQMSKNQLVDEYLQLEDRVEELEKRLKESSGQPVVPILRTTCDSDVQTEQYGHNDDHNCMKSTHDLQQELQKLNEENQRLRCDNERLEGILKDSHIPSHSNDP